MSATRRAGDFYGALGAFGAHLVGAWVALALWLALGMPGWALATFVVSMVPMIGAIGLWRLLWITRATRAARRGTHSTAATP